MHGLYCSLLCSNHVQARAFLVSTVEDEAAIIEAQSTLGNKWAQIAKLLGLSGTNKWEPVQLFELSIRIQQHSMQGLNGPHGSHPASGGYLGLLQQRL